MIINRHVRQFCVFSDASNLLFDPVDSGADGHGLQASVPVQAGDVAAGLPQRLVQPPLQLLSQGKVGEGQKGQKTGREVVKNRPGSLND